MLDIQKDVKDFSVLSKWQRFLLLFKRKQFTLTTNHDKYGRLQYHVLVYKILRKTFFIIDEYKQNAY